MSVDEHLLWCPAWPKAATRLPTPDTSKLVTWRNVRFWESEEATCTTAMGSKAADRDVAIIVPLSAVLADGEM